MFEIQILWSGKMPVGQEVGFYIEVKKTNKYFAIKCPVSIIK